MKKIVLIAILALVLTAVNVTAADPDIESLYAIPNNPYEDTHFDICVEVEDEDGLDRIKFYADGRLEETEDCDEDDDCGTCFDVYETTPGLHVYKVKAYDTEGDTKTDDIRLYVRPYSYPYPYGYCGDGRCGSGETRYNCPQDCRYTSCVGEGGTIGIYPGGGTCCAGLTAISTVSPNSYGVCPSTPVVGASICARCGNGVCGRGENKCNCPRDCPSSYCGDGACNSGESCTSCPQDCGVCVRCGDGRCTGGESCATCPSDCGACVTCGDGRCSSTESCSSCPQDCGNCQPVQPVIYTCEQRGGECCTNGGQRVVSGAADCPSTCFSECNPAPKPEPTPGGGSAPTGAVVIGGTTLILLGGLVILLLLVVFIAARVR